MKTKAARFFCLLLMFAACGIDSNEIAIEIQSLSYDFSVSEHGWTAGFCDFPAEVYDNDSSSYQLEFSHATLPGETGKPGKGLKISGNNHSDDLFMYIKKKIVNLAPDANYTLTYEIELATNAPSDFVGIGGAPGESVYLKVGASEVEPRSVIEDGDYRMNIDKGNQAQHGEDMMTIGDLASHSDGKSFVIVTRTNNPGSTNSGAFPLHVRTNSKGELWLIIGTDSGFEGTTTIYYTALTAVLSRSN